jgi:3-hydroxyisobutyrate dehydrogenase-like beta-hydroxyacid dehydrogenase
MILGCMEVLAEAQTLAEKSGIGAEAVQNLVRGTSTFYLIYLFRRSSILPMHRHSPCRTVRIFTQNG